MQFKEKAIVWFTNNLRVQDNRVLAEACSQYEEVVAVYCFDKALFNETQFGFKKIERFRAKFLLESIHDLKENLKKLNISLVTYFGNPSEVIPSLFTEQKAQAIFFQKEFTSEEEKTIDAVLQRLPKDAEAYEVYDQFLYHPDDIPFAIERIPEVFTSFRKKVEKYVKVSEEVALVPKSKTNVLPDETCIPSLQDLGFQEFEVPVHSAFPFKGGETAVLARLNHYFFETKKLGFYKKTRNGLVGIDYSSKFSPWLANGSISARTIFWEVKKYEAQFGSNQSTYWLIFELIWRDYFKYVSLKHQNKLFYLEGIQQRAYDWNSDKRLLEKWIKGETSEPFVNANMIELQQTGWMSNRGRQNVASYFAKELLLDWRIGAAYFESMLIDYDVHSNYGNWQYVAGVGNDPRNRKFNVKLQAERYDANQKFQRMWLQPTLF